MLNYHSIAHDRCAEQLAQVEADWLAMTLREERGDQTPRTLRSQPHDARQVIAPDRILASLLRLLGQGRLTAR